MEREEGASGIGGGHGRVLSATSQQPRLTLSLQVLPVIPALKLTDRGLVDGDRSSLLDAGGPDLR